MPVQHAQTLTEPNSRAPVRNLRRSLQGVHATFFILAGMIALETLGQVSLYGAQTLTWILVLAVAFVLPYGLIVAELGAAYPYEGGPYPWMRRAWGRTAAGVGAIVYWIATPIWAGGSLCFAAAAAWSTYFAHLRQGSLADWTFKLVFVWAAVAAAIVSLRFAKWIPTVGAIARIVALLVFSVSLVLYALENGLNGVHPHAFLPSSLPTLLGLTPILLFSFQGFELPSTAAEEMRQPEKDVPRSVGIATVVITLAYAIPVFGIVTVLPASKITGIGGFLDAVAKTFEVFGPAAGPLLKIMAATFVVGLLSSGAAWIMGADRAFAVAAQDGAAPGYFGVFDKRFGTPIRVNVMSGLLGTALLILAQELTSGSSATSFALVLYLATSAGIISYLLVLSAGLRLRRVDPTRVRPYRVPIGEVGILAATVLCLFWLSIGTWAGLFPGTLEQLFGSPYSVHENFGVSRLRFEAFTLSTFAAILLIAVASVLLSRLRTSPNRRAIGDE